MKDRIKQAITQSINLKTQLLNEESLIPLIEKISQKMVLALKAGNKILFCGNGGSTADSEHLAGELSGRFYLDRPPLFAEALHVNTSYLTGVANDYSFKEVFARAVEAKGKKGDVLVALSTSGNSENIIAAIEKAKALGLYVVGMTGASGGAMNLICEDIIKIPSSDTPRIQECHMLIGHIICELVEKYMQE